MPIFIGIDPGASGGIALIDGPAVQVWRMPANCNELWPIIESLASDNATCVCERVGANRTAATTEDGQGRRQGASGMFKFGRGFGWLEMALLAAKVPTEFCVPQKWLRRLGLRRGLNETDTAWKNRHKSMAQGLFRGIKVRHWCADALLIAEYGRRSSMSQP